MQESLPESSRGWFDAAMEQPEAQRRDWLHRHCIDPTLHDAVLALLDAHLQTQGMLDLPAAAVIDSFAETEVLIEADSLIGTRIGAFRLLRLLGQGGMATVFLGEREGADFKQHVAVKLLRRGLYSTAEQRLFRRERQALAALSHPNIARLIDGGITEAGIPYLVMEHVNGMPLIQYVVEHKLDLRARLSLFATVCRAADAAHRALIVHRDLKPSNILVADGDEVKLLDFGIAKLLDEDEDGGTHTILAALTPDYAAPEQFSDGPITTATDVYALGVLLHELLLGVRPDKSSKRPSTRIDEIDAGPWIFPAEKPALRRALRGDLDNILLKALAPEPLRRYASAGALSDDIERYLQGQPVAAHPPSRRYRLRKFVRRHRTAVALATCVALAVGAGLWLALWQAGVARREAGNARAEAGRSKQVVDFLGQSLVVGRVGRSTDDVLASLSAIERKAQHDLKREPDIYAVIEDTLASSYNELGEFSSAEQSLQRAIEALRTTDSDATTMTHLVSRRASSLWLLGRRDEARALDAQALTLARSLRADAPERLYTETNDASHACALQPSPECPRRLSELHAISVRAIGESDPLTLRILWDQVKAEIAAGNGAQAKRLSLRLIELDRKRFGAGHVRTLTAVALSADISNRLGEHVEAERLLIAHIPRARQMLGPQHPILSDLLRQLRISQRAQGRSGTGTG